MASVHFFTLTHGVSAFLIKGGSIWFKSFEDVQF